MTRPPPRSSHEGHTLLVPLLCACLLLLTGAGHSFGQVKSAAPEGAVWVLTLDDAVGPATSDYLVRGIESAAAARAQLVVLRIDTPGGLDSAMRDIISAILASPVPVASYVAPGGARAASAGTYILYASHIAAMAPATNLGAATPVSLAPTPPGSEKAEPTPDQPAANNSGGTAMERKMLNDAAAYIRGLAKLRGRNEVWAEEAVRDAVSLAASEALEQGVIDLVAADLGELLKQLEGRELDVPQGSVTLQLKDAPIHEAAPDWRTQFLSIITNPNLVLILGMLGFYGILLEFYNPGSLIPGTIGIICLLLAGYALQILPVNYAGLALLLVGIALMVAEALSPSFGILGVGGIVAFVMGGIMLFDTDVDAFRLGWPVLLGFALATAGFIIVTIGMALRMRNRDAITGVETIIGQHGEVLEAIAEEGMVRVGGEIWRARTEQALAAGDPVRVTAVSGLLLHVEKETV
jgi:membrane-bound serine protease (ClpP class)